MQLPEQMKAALLAALLKNSNKGHGTYDPMFGPNRGEDRDNEPFDGPNAGEHIIGERDDTSHAPGSSMPEDYMRRLYPGNSRNNATFITPKNMMLLNLLAKKFGKFGA